LAKLIICVTKNGIVAENKQTFKSEPHVMLLHAHLQFWTQYGMGLV